MATSFDRSGKGKIRPEEALAYHSSGRKGKVEVIPTKPCGTARELSLAYSPGVAEPCLEIERDNDLAYTYTAKGNLIAVVTNGTAVLGLGNIGAIAGKPVIQIESARDLDETHEFEGARVVGVTGGTSTPIEDLEKVAERVYELAGAPKRQAHARELAHEAQDLLTAIDGQS